MSDKKLDKEVFKDFEVAGSAIPYSDNGKGKLTVSQKDWDAHLTAQGQSKEVRAALHGVQNEVIEAGHQLLGKKVAESRCDKTMVLGTGTDRMIMSMKARREREIVNPQTKEKSTSIKHGVFKVSLPREAPATMRRKGGPIDEMANTIEAAFADKGAPKEDK